MRFRRYPRKQNKKKAYKKEAKRIEYSHELHHQLDRNVDELKRRLYDSPDLVIRTFELGTNHRVEVAIAYIENLVGNDRVDNFIMKSMMRNPEEHRTITVENAFDWIRENALMTGEVRVTSQWIAIAGDYSVHIEEGLKVVPLYLHLPFQIGIPLLLWLTSLVRNRRNIQIRGEI
ncbi:spore germination protein [Melghirimyces algeriensis]|uniref:GerA spore germination protein n=1 Tax=Melghirimyces algeriensis TaxID=910412 RepID=A0A521CCI5_9BACL|nr:spore germination protein [Melghirimyces algeriensis]SMO57136.1 GerA spore germination protein [Melghirimyces algeriensis]